MSSTRFPDPNPAPPKLTWAVAELPRALLELCALLPGHFVLRNAPRGDGHPVLTVPGYQANDNSMRFLRSYLSRWGYDPRTWELGPNLGIGFERLRFEELLCERIDAIYAERGEPVTLIGWSQGGVLARQVAKQLPDQVRHVITLGSPVGSTPEATTIWRVYSRTSPHEITDELMEVLRQVASPVKDVRCTCIFSLSDGIVAPEIACDHVSPLAENICVRASHAGMAVNPVVLYVIADRLAQSEDNWRPFDANRHSRLFFCEGRGPLLGRQPRTRNDR